MENDVYKPVPCNYKGIVKLRPEKIFVSRYHHAYVKLQAGYYYQGDPSNSVFVELYKTYQALINGSQPIGTGTITERFLYVPRERKNNYW